jgi:hypothetical protein
MSERCKEEVSSSDGWRSHRCSYKAVTDAGYCRTHDPELAKQRAAKRGPSRWERERLAREQLMAACDDVARSHPELSGQMERVKKLAWAMVLG